MSGNRELLSLAFLFGNMYLRTFDHHMEVPHLDIAMYDIF